MSYTINRRPFIEVSPHIEGEIEGFLDNESLIKTKKAVRTNYYDRSVISYKKSSSTPGLKGALDFELITHKYYARPREKQEESRVLTFNMEEVDTLYKMIEVLYLKLPSKSESIKQIEESLGCIVHACARIRPDYFFDKIIHKLSKDKQFDYIFKLNRSHL